MEVKEIIEVNQDAKIYTLNEDSLFISLLDKNHIGFIIEDKIVLLSKYEDHSILVDGVITEWRFLDREFFIRIYKQEKGFRKEIVKNILQTLLEIYGGTINIYLDIYTTKEEYQLLKSFEIIPLNRIELNKVLREI